MWENAHTQEVPTLSSWSTWLVVMRKEDLGLSRAEKWSLCQTSQNSLDRFKQKFWPKPQEVSIIICRLSEVPQSPQNLVCFKQCFVFPRNRYGNSWLVDRIVELVSTEKTRDRESESVTSKSACVWGKVNDTVAQIPKTKLNFYRENISLSSYTLSNFSTQHIFPDDVECVP